MRFHSALVVLIVLAGCATQPPAPAPMVCTPPEQHTVLAELLFGLSIPGGGTVTPALFDAYVADELTPRFPDGLTVLAATGQYKPPGGAPEKEASRMVQIVALDDAATAAKLHQAGLAYRTRFHQQSVGLITIQSCASF